MPIEEDDDISLSVEPMFNGSSVHIKIGRSLNFSVSKETAGRLTTALVKLEGQEKNARIRTLWRASVDAAINANHLASPEGESTQPQEE